MSIPLPFKNAQEIENLKKEKEWFEFTPILACADNTETEDLDVRYEVQIGFGCKIKINKDISIVFVYLAVRGYIDAVSTGNNYAYIVGLPYSANGGDSYNYGSFSWGQFSYGIDNSHPCPNGMFSVKRIQVTTQRGGSEKWVAYPNNRVIIYGSGFYFTKD